MNGKGEDMTGYKTRTEGTQRRTRDLAKETPLGVLGFGWQDVTIDKVTCSNTSVNIHLINTFEDKIDTKFFIYRFEDPNVLHERMKALLAATCTDANEVMTLGDALLDGEFHVIGSLSGRRLRVFIGNNGEDVDVTRIGRPLDKLKKLSF